MTDVLKIPEAAMSVISSSYGNDSLALIQWAYEAGLQNVTVAYCDTGWASPVVAFNVRHPNGSSRKARRVGKFRSGREALRAFV